MTGCNIILMQLYTLKKVKRMRPGSRIARETELNKPVGLITLLSKYDHTILSIPQNSEDIRPRYAKLIRNKIPRILSGNKIIDIQLKYIIGHYSKKHTVCRLEENGIWQFIANQIKWLHKEHEIVSYYSNSKITALQNKLEKVFGSVNAHVMIPVSDSNCSYTPWTSLANNNRLYFFSWELKEESFPMLLDLFHYVFQTQVLDFNCNNFDQVKRQVDVVLASKEIVKLSESFSIDVKLHYRIYLLFAVSYYLRLYINQKFPHQRVHNFIDVWHQALSEL